MTECSIVGCERLYAAKGFCHLHYNRWKRHGDPLVARRMTPRGTSLTDRLALLSDRSGGPEACWTWTGTILDGAGRLPYGSLTHAGRPRGAHVWAFVNAGGELSADKPFVLHTCDNSVCVNPAHLYAGTHQRNMDDKVERNRQARLHGESNPRHRLTEDQVHEIRSLQGSAASATVGLRFGVCASTIQQIWNRKRWAHLPDVAGQ